MRMRAFAALVSLCALLPIAGCSRGLAIRFTASLNGALEGCDCRLTPQAGLVKLAAWLRGAHRPGVDLLVDAGDLLAEGRDELLEGYLLDSYTELGYAAIAMGERELEAGPDALLAYRGRYPLAAHNLTLLSAQGVWVPCTPEPIMVRLRDSSVAVLALLGPEAAEGLPPAVSRRIRLESPAEAAARLVRDSRAGGADFVLLLYHGTLESAEAFLRHQGGVDAVILAHEQKLVPAQRLGGAVVTSPGEAGNRVGTLTLRRRLLGGLSFSGAFRSFSARFGPDDPAVRARADAYATELRARLKGATR